MSEKIHTSNREVQGLNQEQSETLNQSLTQRVKEALEKVKSRVKAYLEKDKIKQNLADRKYEEIYEMIEEYPEDIRERIRERIDQELMSEPDILVNRFLDKALAERDKFLYSTDEKGEKKLEEVRVRSLFEGLIKKGDIANIVKNLDLVIQVGLFENIKDLVLSSDENIIQEALKTASPEVRKVYEDKFEKVYLKKEYIDKAIVGAREKGEKAETEEDREKYRRVVEGLEYLRDYEKNVREHCKKMFEQYGIFPDYLVDHILIDINKAMENIKNELIKKLSEKKGLSIVEYVGYLQSIYTEVIRESMSVYTWKDKNALYNIFGNETSRYKRFKSSLENDRPYDQISLDPLGRKAYEKALFGDRYVSVYRGSKECTYGFLSDQELTNGGDILPIGMGEGYMYGSYVINLDNRVKQRCTFSYAEGGFKSPNPVSFLEFPHISGFLNLFEVRGEKDRISRILNDSGDEIILDSLFRQRMFKKSGLRDGEEGNWGFEVQMHGETGSPDQIEYIIYDPNKQNELNQQIIGWVTSHNEKHPEHTVQLVTAEEYNKLRREQNGI